MARRSVTKRRVDSTRMKNFMKQNGFGTQEEFAEYCGISVRSLRTMLSDGAAPITTCYAVAAVFGRTFDDIFGPDNSEELVLWKICMG